MRKLSGTPNAAAKALEAVERTETGVCAERCPICDAVLQRCGFSSSLTIVRCRGCGHRMASHVVGAPVDSDYHAQHVHDDPLFVETLRTTRVRQAGRLIQLVRQVAPGATRLLDFGCGRGWFLDVARQAGFSELAGADVSRIALEGLHARGIEALAVDPEHPDKITSQRLTFRPQVLTLLDVLEHFSLERARHVLSRLVETLAPDLELVVVKVPVSSGLLYRISTVLAKVGAPGPLEQLYQVGSSPPHHCYFSQASLRWVIEDAGLDVVGWARDRDFEPDGLVGRARVLASMPVAVARAVGFAVAGTVRVLRMEDALIGLATPRTR